MCRLLADGDLYQSPASCVCSATSRRQSTTPKRRPKNARASCPPMSSMTRRLAKRIGPASLLRDTRPFSSARQTAAANSAPKSRRMHISRWNSFGAGSGAASRLSLLDKSSSFPASLTLWRQMYGKPRTVSAQPKSAHSRMRVTKNWRRCTRRRSSGWLTVFTQPGTLSRSTRLQPSSRRG